MRRGFKSAHPRPRRVPRATRVVLAPPEPWAEDRLVDALRTLDVPAKPLLPGDDVGGLVVHTVEPHAGAEGDAATLVDVVPHTPRVRPAKGHELLVLLDESASMAQPWSDALTRMEAARHALGVFLARAGKVAPVVTVCAFAKSLRVLAGPAPPGSLSRPDARAVPPAGPCRMGHAIDLALGRLAPDSRAAILLLTDSVGEPKALAAAAARAARLKVPVHVLVLAPDAEPELVDLAHTTRGVLRVAAEVPSLDFVAAALATSAGVPHVWEEPRLPQPGDRSYQELIGPEETILDKLRLRKESAP